MRVSIEQDSEELYVMLFNSQKVLEWSDAPPTVPKLKERIRRHFDMKPAYDRLRQEPESLEGFRLASIKTWLIGSKVIPSAHEVGFLAFTHVNFSFSTLNAILHGADAPHPTFAIISGALEHHADIYRRVASEMASFFPLSFQIVKEV